MSKKPVYIDGHRDETVSVARSDPSGGSIPHGTIMEDSSGNGMDGEYFSTAPGVHESQSVDGLVSGDTAASFDSTAEGIIRDSLIDWDGQFTIEYWTRFGVLGELATFLVTSSDPPTGSNDLFYIYNISAGPGLIRIYVLSRFAGRVWQSDIIPDSIFNADPHHLVVAVDHGNVPEPEVAFYWDGVPLSLAFTNSTDGSTDAPAFIYFGRLNVFGEIRDETAIYSHILSPEEVAAHYAAASTSFSAYTAAILADSPTAYYHLNEGGVTPRSVATTTPGEIKIMKRKATLIDAGSSSVVSSATRPLPIIPFLP